MQSRQLAAYVNAIEYENLSEHARITTKKVVLDIIGVAIAGSVTSEADIWKQYFLSYTSSAPQATVWQSGLASTDYRQAAGLNAALGHILDFDDVHNLAIAHLGVITVPGALGVAQSRGLSGKALMEAITAGFEVGARVGHAINPSAYRIWHTTGVVGALSTGVAVGKLLGLDDTQMLNAMGSAGTQSAGLWEFMSDGAMSKPLHTANATLCGIRAAELAMLGLTGATRILEGEQGLLKALSREYRPELLTEDMDGDYLISDNSFKLYPCCRHIHSAIYSIIKLLEKSPVSPDQIAAIRSYTYMTAQNLTNRPDPATLYACKFSMQYCLSAIAEKGHYDPSIFDAAAMEDPAVRELMKRVEVINDAGINEKIEKDATCWANHLELQRKDGTVLTEDTDYPPGDAHMPISWEDAAEKFHGLADSIIGAPRADRIVAQIARLDELDNVADIFTF